MVKFYYVKTCSCRRIEAHKFLFDFLLAILRIFQPFRFASNLSFFAVGAQIGERLLGEHQ